MPAPPIAPPNVPTGALAVPVPEKLGLRMADGSWVDLQPLPLSLEAVAGTTGARLSGTPVAEMATARVMRAAQAFFELPTKPPAPAAAAAAMRAASSTCCPASNSL